MKKHVSREPGDVDAHVGRRMDLRRKLLAISQETLADSIGVSFQQIQKYSSGQNRIAASRLYEIAKTLKVDVSFFFEELPPTGDGDFSRDLMNMSRAIEVVTLFNKIALGKQDAAITMLKALHARD